MCILYMHLHKHIYMYIYDHICMYICEISQYVVMYIKDMFLHSYKCSDHPINKTANRSMFNQKNVRFDVNV